MFVVTELKSQCNGSNTSPYGMVRLETFKTEIILEWKKTIVLVKTLKQVATCCYVRQRIDRSMVNVRQKYY